MSKAYIDYERNIVEKFNKIESVMWNGVFFDDVKACKPKPQGGGGEPKTDVYVRLHNTKTGFIDILKISVKLDNAEFLGNKLTASAAESLFGLGWEEIVKDAVYSLKDKFPLKNIKYKKTKKGEEDAYFTLGWKLEIANKGRDLSVEVDLSRKELIDYIYKGVNQPIKKRDSIIFNGEISKNSGVAEYLIIGNDIKHHDVQSILDSIIPLDYYTPPKIYAIFTANNYRFIADKADGQRSLAVCIRWELIGNDLHPNFIFDQPLKYKGERDMMPYIKSCLSRLSISSFDDMDNLF